MEKLFAKVNYSAVDTWLEPYIGWEFEVKKVTRDNVYFYMDNGKGNPDLDVYTRSKFDLITKEVQQ